MIFHFINYTLLKLCAESCIHKWTVVDTVTSLYCMSQFNNEMNYFICNLYSIYDFTGILFAAKRMATNNFTEEAIKTLIKLLV